MLALNIARYFYRIKLSGIRRLFELHTLEGADLLIVLGAYLLVKPWTEKRPANTCVSLDTSIAPALEWVCRGA